MLHFGCVLLLSLGFLTCYVECCTENEIIGMSKYSKVGNEIVRSIQESVGGYVPCSFTNCSCYSATVGTDLLIFKDGITKNTLKAAQNKGTTYKIINGELYRSNNCLFPSRCSGVEYFLLKLKDELQDVEFVINTRDWPQVMKFQRVPLPVFSFSKTSDYLDILYPAWAFWAGGPAIKLYPRGLGDWGGFRSTLNSTSKKIPWETKIPLAFFRGSRTHNERDSLVLLSRKEPNLADAAYTKNQAWKSIKDTLNAPPADEVSLEDHCKYKYLFNFRGVAASFRFKYLFLCGSLVFNVGSEWFEFFYPAMRPWVHYIPVKSGVTEDEIKSLIIFFKEHDKLAQEIAQRGQDFIWNHLSNEDVLCYWKFLLTEYTKLLQFKPELDGTEVNISY